MRRSISAAALAALVVAAAAAAQSQAQAKVLLRTTSLGAVLVDARGHTLYLYTGDHGGKSTCSATCSLVWPPFIVAAKPRAGTGVRAALLGTTKRQDGRLQATYAGHPLYFYASDARPGDVKGQGQIGTWFAVAASGERVTPSQPRTEGKVLLRTTSLGAVLVDARGHTLYLYTGDRGGKSTCDATCSLVWPPFIVAAKPHAGAGVTATLLGTTKRQDGRLQATYAGHPLYFYTADTRPGDVKGQGQIGTWYAVAASGERANPTQPTTTTTPGDGYGGGGYEP